MNSDFTIDNEGTIHCVWNLKYGSNYAVIYYACSEDDGNTWSSPESISQNEIYYCTDPQIVHDQDNNLYVGYDLNNYEPVGWGSYVYLVKKDGHGWGEPMEFSEGIATRLCIDNNNRVYVF